GTLADMGEDEIVPGIDKKLIEEFKRDFEGDAKNLIARNVITRHGLSETYLDRAIVNATSHVFQYKVSEAKPITNNINQSIKNIQNTLAAAAN
ncbi:hypothetical protein TrispH2_006868, partial [Trichoplax sp. H2]